MAPAVECLAANCRAATSVLTSWGGLQPAPGYRHKDKLVELPKELAGSSYDVTVLDVRSSDETDVRCIIAPPMSCNSLRESV